MLGEESRSFMGRTVADGEGLRIRRSPLFAARRR
jgi:hypothetical protein